MPWDVRSYANSYCHLYLREPEKSDIPEPPIDRDWEAAITKCAHKLSAYIDQLALESITKSKP